MKLVLRENPSALAVATSLLWAMVATLVLSGILLFLAQVPVLDAFWLIIKGALGKPLNIADTLTRATPLIFTGLAVAIAFRGQVWNIGAEGQFYLGAVMAVVICSGIVPLPGPLLVLLAFVFGALAGGLLLLFSVFLKQRFRADEVVTTLLMNFIVVPLVGYLVFNPLKDPMAMGWPRSLPVIETARLPILIPASNLTVGFILAVALAVILWLVIRYTRVGFAIRAVGHSPGAAAFVGISPTRVMILVGLASGGLAGLAGVIEVLGPSGFLTADLSPGYGYTGIAVAMLAGLNPIGAVFAAIVLSIIYIGTNSMSQILGVSTYLADIISATSLLAILAATVLMRYRIVRTAA